MLARDFDEPLGIVPSNVRLNSRRSWSEDCPAFHDDGFGPIRFEFFVRLLIYAKLVARFASTERT